MSAGSSPLKRKNDEINASNEVAGKMMMMEVSDNGCETPSQSSSSSGHSSSSSQASTQASSSQASSSQASSSQASGCAPQALTNGRSQASSSQASSSQASGCAPQALPNGNVQNGIQPHNIPSPLPRPLLFQLQVPGPGWLQLQQGRVFDQLMHGFAENRSPTVITYNGRRHFLTEAYEEFWSALYNSAAYTRGYGTKLLAENLTGDEALQIARILRRGWEDEHYFPKKIAQPFLEACIFNRENVDNVHATADILYDYIDPTDKQVLESRHIVDQDSMEVFKRYCDIDSIKIGSDMNSTCKAVARSVMVTNIAAITKEIWTWELVGLLNLEEFKYLMKYRTIATRFVKVREDDMDNNVAPHKIWHTFFYGWDEEKIDYYQSVLQNDSFPQKCHHCRGSIENSKHLLGCSDALSTMRLERHDCVLMKIYRELKLATEKRNNSYFTPGDDWKVIVNCRNKHYEWPRELIGFSKYPHLMAYSTSPTRRVLIIEPSISWDHWIPDQRKGKIREFESIVRILQAYLYHVTFVPLVLGTRGVLSEELFLLLEAFGMTRSNISRTMEEISKVILSIPYNDYKDTAWNEGTR